MRSIDLEFDLDQGRFRNVRFHRGDSHALLPGLLDDFARSGRNVDLGCGHLQGLGYCETWPSRPLPDAARRAGERRARSLICPGA